MKRLLIMDEEMTLLDAFALDQIITLCGCGCGCQLSDESSPRVGAVVTFLLASLAKLSSEMYHIHSESRWTN
jgi:hypothetical protein